MKKTLISIVAKAVFLVIVSALMAQAQTTYKQSGESYIVVAGTSTLHNWTMTSKEPALQVAFDLAADGTPTQVKNLSLTVAAQSLKSQHNGMDKNAYSSLKVDKYKNITFVLTSAKVEKGTIQCTGSLTIAGVTKPVTLDAAVSTKPNGILHCQGSKTFKMSEYQVEPPTFMFGSVKTGDEITVTFNLDLAPVKI
jgi:polyisoprenoid-binding protein YceI